MKKSAIFFDLDGVLWDSMPFHVEAFNEILQPFGRQVNESLIGGKRTRDIFSDLFEKQNFTVNIEDLISAKQSLFRTKLAAHKSLLLDANLSQVIMTLGETHQLGICTSGSQGSLDLFFEISGLKNQFDFTITASEVQNCKPHPEIYLKALEKSGLESSQACIVEDSETGARAGYEAGIRILFLSRQGEVNLNFPYTRIHGLVEILDVAQVTKR